MESPSLRTGETGAAQKMVRGFCLKKMPNGNIQVYAKKRSRQLAAIGIKHSAWRLAFELTPTMINDLHRFINDNA